MNGWWCVCVCADFSIFHQIVQWVFGSADDDDAISCRLQMSPWLFLIFFFFFGTELMNTGRRLFPFLYIKATGQHLETKLPIFFRFYSHTQSTLLLSFGSLHIIIIIIIVVVVVVVCCGWHKQMDWYCFRFFYYRIPSHHLFSSSVLCFSLQFSEMETIELRFLPVLKCHTLLCLSFNLVFLFFSL